jgi:toxin FitB
MRYLLDTNFLSELRKAQRANVGVLKWASANDSVLAALSVVTIAEIRKGIEKKRRTDISQARVLEAWFGGVLTEFASNILPVTLEIAERWGKLMAAHESHERDLLIAATALEHGLTVITCNASDFAGTGVRIVNPWK